MKIIALVSCTFMVFLAPAWAQSQPISPADMLTYSWQEGPNGNLRQVVWGGESQVSAKIQKRADGNQIYTLGVVNFIIDPLSLAASFSPREDFTLRVNTTKTGSDLVIGTTWKNTSYASPIPGGPCTSDSRLTYTYTVQDVQAAKVFIDGKETEVQSVSIFAKGDWWACGYSGGLQKTLIYSPELQLILQYQVVGFKDGVTRTGNRMVLKEIRRGS